MKKILIALVIFCATSFAQEIGARYLIITHDNYYDAIQPLAQWKHKKGMRTKVVKLSQIGSSASQIKTYITTAYNNWQIPPEFLLLVGAPNYLPFPTVSGTYSDNYYTNVQGDLYNEILSGRLTVHNATEAQTVVNKILCYERTPDIEDPLWFKKACLIVNMDYDPDDSIYWSDLHHAAGLMVDNGFVEIDSLSDMYGHNTTSVINAVNNGRSIVMYRGVGFNNWSYPFSVNPDQTQNGTKLPIVLSTTCRTIGLGSTPAAAEKWLLTGTPTTPRGASGYFATTTTVMNQAYLRSAVAKGFHSALFNQNKRTFGETCEEGRKKVYAMYTYVGGYDEYLGFTTLGDPEMNIWTDTPCSLICTHPLTIPAGSANFTVNVVNAANSSPINNAIVCVMGKLDSTVYTVDTTDSSGNANFTVVPYFTGDTVYVTVTGKNLQPYEGSMLTTGGGSEECYYIWNPDPTPTPGENMHTILTNLGYSGDYGTTLAPDLTQYQAVFVCVGIYNNNYVIDASSSEAAKLVDFLENHSSRMYLEGGDVWYYDVQSGGYDFGPLFGINGASDGTGDMGPVIGESSVFTQGMSFTYGGENSWMDHINSTGSGFLIFHDGNDAYNCGIANDEGTYQTVGTSFELGLLVDDSPPSTRAALLDSIMRFFGITPGITETTAYSDLSYSHFEVYPNPFSKLTYIKFQVPSSKSRVTIKIYDATGRLVRQWDYSTIGLSDHVIWSGKDNRGRKLPQGVYFVKFTAEDFTKTQKIILLK